MLRGALTQLANTVRDEGTVDERESCIDASLAGRKAAGDRTLNYSACLQSVFVICALVK